MKTFKTTCKVGACEPQCGLEIDVDKGNIVDVRPDKSHPISKGYICIKGKAIPEYQNDPERLLHPLRRTSSGWENTDWKSATSEIGQKLRALVNQYGPTSVATYWGNAADSTGMIAANTICSGLSSPNSFNVLSLEYTDRGMVAKEVLGEQTLILQPDADNTHFALLLGTNPLVTQGMTLLQRHPRIAGDLKNISKRGGKLVVVDPRITETTHISDQHIMIKPGMDLYLLLGMIKRILNTGKTDSAFLNRYATGKERWWELVRDYDLSWAAEITGVAKEVIIQLADEFAAAKSGFVTTRVGVQTSHNSTLTEWAVFILNAITGNIDRPGGLYFNPGALDNTALIHKFTKRKNPAPSRVGKYPQIFGGPPCSVFADDVLSDDPGRIRALIVIAGNPVISFPNTKKIEKALEKLDLLVCIDLNLSDTGSFADYNLPATSIYEKGGLHFMTFPFEPYPFAEWRQKLVEPKGNARPEWDIARDISRAAGIPFLNNPMINVIDRLLGVFGSAFTEKHLAQYLFSSGMARKKISINKLINAEGGIKFGDIKWGQFVSNGILTSDKKIHLAPDKFIEGLKQALKHPPSVSKQFPFMLISGGRRLASFNSWTHNMPAMMKKLKGNYALMNTSDGLKLGIQDGVKIKITSKIHSVEIKVVLSTNIREGVIMVHQFWGHNYKSGQSLARKYPGVNVNLLHDDQVKDKYTGMPVYNGTPCNIEPFAKN